MHRRKRKRHVEGTVLASLVLSAAALATVIVLVTIAGGTTGAKPDIPSVAALHRPSATSIVLPPDEPHGSAPLHVTAAVPSVVTPPAPGGTAPTRDRMAAEVAESQVVEREAARKQGMIDRLTAYMRATNTVQGLIDLAPLMVDLGEQTGNDARICPVTAVAESSGGRACCGSCNPFGALGMSFGSWEQAVRYYFTRITQFGFSGDVQRIACFWYGGGSSMDGRAESYAANIVNSVESI